MAHCCLPARSVADYNPFVFNYFSNVVKGWFAAGLMYGAILLRYRVPRIITCNSTLHSYFYPMLLERFISNVKKIYPPGWPVTGTWLLAVSGGVDSVVLCDLVYKAGIDFVIAHCNFQLRDEESTKDENFVRNLGEKYGRQVLVKHFNTNAYAEQHKKSIQVAARELCYDWFNQLLENAISSTVSGNGEELDQNKIAVTTPGITPSLIRFQYYHLHDGL